jgi:hypothetical protein
MSDLVPKLDAGRRKFPLPQTRQGTDGDGIQQSELEPPARAQNCAMATKRKGLGS